MDFGLGKRVESNCHNFWFGFLQSCFCRWALTICSKRCSSHNGDILVSSQDWFVRMGHVHKLSMWNDCWMRVCPKMGVFASLLLGWWNTFAVFDFVEAACCCRWGLDPDPSTKLKTYLSFFECFNCCQVGKHVCCCKSFARILNAFTCFAKQDVRVNRANPPAEVQQLNLVAIAAEAEVFVMQHSFLHFHKLYQQHHFKGTSSCWRIPTRKNHLHY